MENRRIVWFDGSVSAHAPGKLLSDNAGYYGDCVMTGVTYTYACTLRGIGDTPLDFPEMVGRRLLDGGIDIRARCVESAGAMQVIFDFQRRCFFRELDLAAASTVEHVTAAISADGREYATVYDGTPDQHRMLCRLPLADAASARYLRLTVEGGESVRLFQVWAFGDADPAYPVAEAIPTLSPYAVANSVAMESLRGIPQTAFTDVEGFRWRKRLIRHGLGTLEAAFSQLPAYDSVGARPILPEPEAVNAPVSVRLCRGGIENVCLALTNTDTDHDRDLTVSLGETGGLRAELSVAGTIASRWYGTNIGPLFNEEHRISASHMKKYLANADVITDFPLLHLPAGGSVVLFLKLYAQEAAPGDYTVTVRAGNAAVDVRAQVLDITLPTPRVGMLLWSDETVMLPFHYEDRPEQEAAYRNELGITIYDGWPEPGTVGAAALRENPHVQFMIWGLGDFGHDIYCNRLRPEEVPALEAQIVSIVQGHVQHAQELGLGYDQWFLSTADEPGAHNAQLMGAFFRVCKRVFPQVRLYANPAFWAGFDHDAVTDDDTICASLEGWYDLVDLSMPLVLNLYDRPKAYRYFTAPRAFNGQYNVSAQHMRSDRRELLNLPRSCAWDSLARDMNLWGFFAYFRPEADCWNDMDRAVEIGYPDYQCVFAGENGPIPTRASELVREGWQDYRLMTLLKEKAPALYRALQQEYLDGNSNFPALRERILDALLA